MNPRTLSKHLRRIAVALDSSKNPSRELVLKDLRRLTIAMGGFKLYESGDPATTGYSVVSREFGENHFDLQGTVFGHFVDGILALNVENGRCTGHDWEGVSLPEDVMQQCLDFFADRY